MDIPVPPKEEHGKNRSLACKKLRGMILWIAVNSGLEEMPIL